MIMIWRFNPAENISPHCGSRKCFARLQIFVTFVCSGPATLSNNTGRETVLLKSLLCVKHSTTRSFLAKGCGLLLSWCLWKKWLTIWLRSQKSSWEDLETIYLFLSETLDWLFMIVTIVIIKTCCCAASSGRLDGCISILCIKYYFKNTCKVTWLLIIMQNKL